MKERGREQEKERKERNITIIIIINERKASDDYSIFDLFHRVQVYACLPVVLRGATKFCVWCKPPGWVLCCLRTHRVDRICEETAAELTQVSCRVCARKGQYPRCVPFVGILQNLTLFPLFSLPHSFGLVLVNDNIKRSIWAYTIGAFLFHLPPTPALKRSRRRRL